MPIWTNTPPEDPRGYGLPIIRTPATGGLEAIVTSTDLIGCDTHFWGGHTVPCDRPECDACEAGVRYDWHGYLSAFNPKDQLHFIFEMTAQAATKFTNFKAENKFLRTALFRAHRWGKRKNGRIMIKVEFSAFPDHALPNPPIIHEVMAIIWRLPAKDVFTAGVQRNVTRVHAETKGNGQSSDPKLYQEPNPKTSPPPAA